MNIDLNCDAGEGFGPYQVGEQAEIFKYISSANIACGFHSGDPSLMRETVELAIQNNVKIGAHPGLPDLIGFGRREMNISPSDAYDAVVYQIGALQGFLAKYNEPLHHVKPHGALYNMAAKDPALAKAIAQSVYDVSPSLILFGLSGGALVKAGEEIGLPTAQEAFADRTYQDDGSLTARTEPGAMITDTNESVDQILRLIHKGTVHTMQETEIPLQAQTICVHGDSAEALQFVQSINQTLRENNIDIRSVQA